MVKGYWSIKISYTHSIFNYKLFFFHYWYIEKKELAINLKGIGYKVYKKNL